MKVNRDNYESFFIDYLDGNIANELVDDLLDFLRENADLANELHGLEKIKLEPYPEETFNAQSLIKNDLDQTDLFEENCIRFMENDMDAVEKELFLHYIEEHPKNSQILKLYKATILIPDDSEVFDNLKSLKKQTRIITPLWYWSAAVLVIGLLLWSLPHTYETVVQTDAIQPSPVEKQEMVSPNENHINLNTVQEKVITPKSPLKNVQVIVSGNQTSNTIPSIDVEREMLVYMQPMTVRQIPSLENNIALEEFLNPSNQMKDYSNYQTIPEYLASEVNKLEPKEKLHQVGIGTLKTLRNISNDKFDFVSNQQGKVQKLEFNTKLLAFTIPVNSER